jgi:arylsulfatase A-like enzyme
MAENRKKEPDWAVSAFCLSALILAAFLNSCSPGQETGKIANPPNIVLIMADDLGYEGLSCNGGTTYRTPNLDKLARTGVRFTHCYSTPLCTPSRVQIMTGKYNFRNYTEFGSLARGETTFAHLLQEAGYVTCVAGKWQLAGHYEGSNYLGVGTFPEEAGFDEHCLWQVQKLGSRYWDPVIQQNSILLEGLEGRYGPDVVCDFIVDFIQRHKGDRFFVYYPMILTHSPFVPTPLDDADEQHRFTKDKANFTGMVAYTDVLVGRIVKALDELGLRGDTLIVFTCDNGSPVEVSSRMGSLTIAGQKGYTTDAGTHVPLIASWPGQVVRGRICDDLVDFTDFLPTLLQTAGTGSPESLVLDGRSFLPQALGRVGDPRDWVFCHYDPRWGQWALKRFARDKRWKLYGDGEFFDLLSDPLEEHPLSVDQLDGEAVEAKIELQGVLDTMHKEPPKT